MSAIPSLIRVMTLRGSEAMIIESGRVPLLRRRGNLEPLTTGAIDEATLIEFFDTLAECGETGKPKAKVVRRYLADDGGNFDIALEPTAAGVRLLVSPRGNRDAKPAAPQAGQSASTPSAAPPVQFGEPVVQRAAQSAGEADPRRGLAAVANELANLLGEAIAEAASSQASDLFVSSTGNCYLRSNGLLRSLSTMVDTSRFVSVVAPLVSACGGEVDLAIAASGQRVRANLFAHADGFSAALRIIRQTPPSLTELELPPQLAKIADHREGLVLFCGPTGSGKSTSLAAIVAHIDQQRAAHIVTIEDPIEYRFVSQRGVVHQRELGTHTESFASGLRAALREAPDVILLGELRDPATIAAALTAAETGHLVLATMHAPNAAVAVDRIIDSFPEAQARAVRSQLSAVLRTVVTQYLLPRVNGGRVAALELVPVTPAIANIIRKGEMQTLATAITSGGDAGMVALERSLAKLVASRAISQAVANRVAADADLLNSLLRNAR